MIKIEIPDFLQLHKTAWDDWWQMRKEEKYPRTQKVMRANFRALKQMVKQGHCPSKVLRRAIAGHPIKGPWQGLFSSEATLKDYVPPEPEMLRMSNSEIAEEAIRRINGLIKDKHLEKL